MTQWNPPSDRFLILRQKLQDAPGAKPRRLGSGPIARTRRAMRSPSAASSSAQQFRQAQHDQNSPSYGLPVQEPLVAARFLERMAEGVAQVKNASQARFALVPAHDLHFDFRRARQDCFQAGGLLRTELRRLALPVP